MAGSRVYGLDDDESDSRGTGAAVCAHYSKAAAKRHSGLPRELQKLAWLDLDSAEGQEYWRAMNLMGEYAAANIHDVMAAQSDLVEILGEFNPKLVKMALAGERPED